VASSGAVDTDDLPVRRVKLARRINEVARIEDTVADNGKPDRPVPVWDQHRRALSVGDVLVKQFKVPAPNQIVVLSVFQEESWPIRIDDPLPPCGECDSKRRLHDTINALNRSQKVSLIRFCGDGSGEGVRWELLD